MFFPDDLFGYPRGYNRQSPRAYPQQRYADPYGRTPYTQYPPQYAPSYDQEDEVEEDEDMGYYNNPQQQYYTRQQQQELARQRQLQIQQQQQQQREQQRRLQLQQQQEMQMRQKLALAEQRKHQEMLEAERALKQQLKEEKLRKKEEEKKQQHLEFISRPEVRDNAATSIQNVWRGHHVRQSDVIGRLRLLKQVEDDVTALVKENGSFVEGLTQQVLGEQQAMTSSSDVKKDRKRLLGFEEALTRKLLSLDAIPSGNNVFIRNTRKQVVTRINDILSSIEPVKKEITARYAVIRQREEEEARAKELAALDKEPRGESMIIEEEVRDANTDNNNDNNNNNKLNEENDIPLVKQLQTVKVEDITPEGLQQEKDMQKGIYTPPNIPKTEEMEEDSQQPTHGFDGSLTARELQLIRQLEELKSLVLQKDEYISKLESELELAHRKHQPLSS